MARRGPIVGIGELLWDLLPAGPQPGGAPFNFAFHCHQLGYHALIVSRVGDDELGRRLLAEVRARGLTDEFVQLDPAHSTGTVQVQVGPAGQPSYTIVENVAYDFLDWVGPLDQLARSCQAVCFGTLAQRAGHSRETIRRFVTAAADPVAPARVVFDINLRQHYYTRRTVVESLAACDWLKLNESELAVLGALFQMRGHTDVDLLCAIGERFRRMDLLCLTRGERGCQVRDRDGNVIDQPGMHVAVADTVGAGDAFAAGLLTQILAGRAVAEAAGFAARFAALVASRPGGTPHIGREEIQALL